MGLVVVGLLLWPPQPLTRAITKAHLDLSYLLLAAAVLTLTPLLTLTAPRFNLLCLGAGALILSTLLPVGMERLSQQRSPRELGRIVRSRWQPNDALVEMYLYSQGLSFYSGQITHLMESRTELDFGRRLAPARQRELYLSGPSDLADLARTHPKIFLYIKEQDLGGLRPQLPGKMEVLGRQGDCLLLDYERE